MSVIYEKKGKIAYITINRPKNLNAINNETSIELERIWSDFNDDPAISVAVITGAGDKSFSAGVDVKELDRGIGGDSNEVFWNPEKVKLLPYEINIRKPIIAAVNGFCVGIGLAIILGCDIRIASENASFSMPEVKLGMSVRGVAPLLARLLPLSLTMEMLLTGNSITAHEAYQYGLISKLVTSSELIPTAENIANAICENAPLAVRATKESVLKGIELPFEHANRLATSLNYALLNSEDFREGIRAVKEKRKPIFKGK